MVDHRSNRFGGQQDREFRVSSPQDLRVSNYWVWLNRTRDMSSQQLACRVHFNLKYSKNPKITHYSPELFHLSQLGHVENTDTNNFFIFHWRKVNSSKWNYLLLQTLTALPQQFWINLSLNQTPYLLVNAWFFLRRDDHPTYQSTPLNTSARLPSPMSQNSSISHWTLNFKQSSSHHHSVTSII